MAALARVFDKPIRTNKDDTSPVEFNFVLPDQFMGIEIEAENLGAGTVLPSSSTVTPYWLPKPDGSLQRGTEYVLTNPLSGKELSRAISKFFRTARLHTAATSSTHIHLDMTEEETSTTVLQLLFALVYVLEPILWHAGDSSRKWCGFTHPISWADPALIATLFSEGFSYSESGLTSQLRHTSRYFGLNLAALPRYGSLEFRYFPTATSGEQLAGWVNLVQQFKKAALELGSMRALSSIMEEENSYLAMLTQYFPEHSQTIQELVPYSQARKSFFALTESFHGQVWPSREYNRIVESKNSLQKMLKRKRQVVRDTEELSPTFSDSSSFSRWATQLRNREPVPGIFVDTLTGVTVARRDLLDSASNSYENTISINLSTGNVRIPARNSPHVPFGWIQISDRILSNVYYVTPEVRAFILANALTLASFSGHNEASVLGTIINNGNALLI